MLYEQFVLFLDIFIVKYFYESFEQNYGNHLLLVISAFRIKLLSLLETLSVTNTMS